MPIAIITVKSPLESFRFDLKILSNCLCYRYTLNKGADPMRLTCSRRNLLHIAADSGNLDILSTVIQVYRSRKILDKMINSKDRYNGVELCFLIRGRDNGR